MRWLINEWHDFRDEIRKKIDDHIAKQIGAAVEVERITKLEGEIRAMKARMGKKD